MYWGIKYNGIFETGTPCGPSFGTQLMSFWTKQASLEKAWVTSMLKGTTLFPPVTFTVYSYSVHVFHLNMCFSAYWTCSQVVNRNKTLPRFLDGCQEWRRTSRRLMSTTDPWMVMEISTGGSSLGLTICLPNSCVSFRGKWVRSWIRNKASSGCCS